MVKIRDQLVVYPVIQQHSAVEGYLPLVDGTHGVETMDAHLYAFVEGVHSLGVGCVAVAHAKDHPTLQAEIDDLIGSRYLAGDGHVGDVAPARIPELFHQLQRTGFHILG